MKTIVFCTLQFEGFHHWPDAPAIVGFLRYPHRHIFHVRAEVMVSHGDRDVEFILLKRAVLASIVKHLGTEQAATWSCEQWAETILLENRLSKCEVSEDGENGAIVIAEV